MAEWPAKLLHKHVRVHGTIRGNPGGWRIENATTELTNLADRIGDTVSLEGTFWSLNGHWWFSAAGENLYVTDADNRTVTFPSSSHARAARVTGKLLRQLRPALDQVSLKSDRDLVPTFVVAHAKFEFLEVPITVARRFHRLSDTPPQYEDGVPLLVPEFQFQHSHMDFMTTAWYFLRNNSDTIDTILQDPTPHTLGVLARRMLDAKRDATTTGAGILQPQRRGFVGAPKAARHESLIGFAAESGAGPGGRNVGAALVFICRPSGGGVCGGPAAGVSRCASA